MSHINEDVEISIQGQLPKSTCVTIDGCELYTNIHFFRYVEGSKHITGDCNYRIIDEPWFWLPWILREIFSRKLFILKLENPTYWDNEDHPIPKDCLSRIVSRIDQALAKKHSRYKIEFCNMSRALQAAEEFP
jgi:hypothetical protein